ncbi:MAG: type II toxin-antitoxin system RelE/ParE family toxin [Acidobacteriota bacterium]|nr:type II toxin-antitoxin system RelE/ParE family toxin [Acidobacteriota bacterium]
MEFRVDVTPRAQQDLDRIYDWVVSHAPIAGLRWFERFENSILSLSNFPDRCPVDAKLSSRRQTIRQLVFGTTRHKYRVYFTIRDKAVMVLHIRHGSRTTPARV